MTDQQRQGPFESVDPLHLVDDGISPELKVQLPTYVETEPGYKFDVRGPQVRTWQPDVALPPPPDPAVQARKRAARRQARNTVQMLVMVFFVLAVASAAVFAALAFGGPSGPKVGPQPAPSSAPARR